jgi:hypothetical protein
MLLTLVQLLAYLSVPFLLWMSGAGFVASKRFAYPPLLLFSAAALLLALSSAIEIGYPLFGLSAPVLLFVAVLGIASGGLLLWWFQQRYQGIAPLRYRGITFRDIALFRRAKA